MNELNSNWVLWASIGALALTIVSFFAFYWKINKGMNNVDKKKTKRFLDFTL